MKKLITIFILFFCSLIPLLFTATIPYSTPAKLNLGLTKSNEHLWSGDNKLYVITLAEGAEYTINAGSDGFWSLDLSLRIGEAPYMINGFSVDSGGLSFETMHFTALKTGNYYIQVRSNSGSGFIRICVESGIVGSPTGSNVEFFNVSYLLVLILPSVFIMAVGMLVLILLARGKKASVLERRNTYNVYKKVKKEKTDILENKEKRDDQVEKEGMIICEYCGVIFNQNLKKCPSCHSYLN